MKSTASSSFLRSDKGFYAFIVFLLIGLLTVIAGYLFFQLIPKETRLSLTPAVLFEKPDKTVYLLRSKENYDYLKSNTEIASQYGKNILRLQERLTQIGYNVKPIGIQEIEKLPANAVLVALDTYMLSKEAYIAIERFVNHGGNLLFNYRFGYFSNGQKRVGPTTIQSITGLRYLGEIDPQKKTPFYILKGVSPFEGKRDITYRHNLILYGNDTVPLFASKTVPDAIMCNWAVTDTPKLNNHALSTKESGIIWHGKHGKGVWFYFSYPLYSFLDMPNELFAKMFHNAISYMKTPITASVFPFIHTDKAVFVSEDTEFKYANMVDFVDLAVRKKIPVTLFCVAKLAREHSGITKSVAQIPGIEIASHSYSHQKIMGAATHIMQKEIVDSKKILEQITGKEVVGFRPPREEISKEMVDFLQEAGYRYIMEKTKNYLIPMAEHKPLVTIPRHGTDDYLYLIKFIWNADKIYNKIVQETQMLTDMNTLYTLSIHTHLLGYKKNLAIVDRYFDYLNSRKDIMPMTGREIAKTARQSANISIRYQHFENKSLLFISNNNDDEVKDLTIRIYWPKKVIKSIQPELVNVATKIIRTNLAERYSDVHINALRPHSETTFIVTYR